jgi:hypothetical protein
MVLLWCAGGSVANKSTLSLWYAVIWKVNTGNTVVVVSVADQSQIGLILGKPLSTFN